MNIKQAKEEIKHTVEAYLLKEEDGSYRIPVMRQRPMLLIGPPGIGKTQIMEQIARECQIGLVSYTITHHTRQSAVGLPVIKEEEFEGKKYTVTEYTMSEIIASVYSRIRDFGQKEGILFIDEINCVSETLTPAMLQFLQCKTFGNQKIPEGWIIVAAGNPPEYNRSVRDFDMVTLDRVRYISVEADYKVWKNYALEQEIHGAVLSYLELRPKNFYRAEETVDGLSFVTARGWEDLSTLLKVYEKLSIPVTEDMIREFIHDEEIAQELYAYLELYRKYEDDYRMEEILKGNVPAEIYARLMNAEFDERLSVVNLLLDALGKHFSEIYFCKDIADVWYQMLKDYKSSLLNTGGTRESEWKIYDNLIEDVEKEMEQQTNNGYLTPYKKKRYSKLISLLKENHPSKQSQNQDSFDAARSGFAVWTKQLAEGKKLTLRQLEYAFDFMESAFEEEQDMLVFVTGLTTRKESAVFLADNLCERYLEYNEKYLAGTKRAEILQEINR